MSYWQGIPHGIHSLKIPPIKITIQPHTEGDTWHLHTAPPDSRLNDRTASTWQALIETAQTACKRQNRGGWIYALDARGKALHVEQWLMQADPDADPSETVQISLTQIIHDPAEFRLED